MPHQKTLRAFVPIIVAAASAALWARQTATVYFPAKGVWEKREPAALGLSKAKLDEAIAFSVTNEATGSKDLAIETPIQFRNEAPYNNLIGPTQPRTGVNGVVIRHGYVAAEWGDTSRADMTY